MGVGDQPKTTFSVTSAGMRALLEHVDEVVICCDADGTIRFASNSFRTLLGYAPELFIGRNIIEIVHPDRVEEAINALSRWNGRIGTPRGDPTTVKTADGEWIDVRYDAAIGDDFGDCGTLVLTVRPEGTLNRSERELRARARNDDRLVRLATAFLNLPTDEFGQGVDITAAELGSLENVTRVSVWRMIDEQLVRQASWQAAISAPKVPLSRRIRVNEYASTARAAKGDDVMLTNPWLFDDSFAADKALFDAAGVTSCLICPMFAGDEFVGIIMLESTLPDSFGAVHLSATHSACAVLAEAFLRNDAERLLAKHAHSDRVTGLANRWAFDVDLECALDDLKDGTLSGIALAVVDLDRFKVVNDTFGHSVGDHLLAEVALRLRRHADGNTTLARLGGDEILVLIQGVPDADEAIQRIEALMSALKMPFNLPTGVMSLTASVGVSHTTDGDTEMGELMSQADVAMYRMKAIGGDAIALADPDSHIARSQRLRRENDLARAVEAGTLSAHFQPEYELATGKLLGAEALVRWQHPRDGLLSAAEFVPLIETSGLVEEMGRQVLRSACAQWAQWVEENPGDHLLLRVNVAARQLRQDSFVYQVEDVIKEAGLAPEHLCLELTESSLLDDPQAAASRFAELRALGVGLAIDDFGTGYSSYLQLRSLPLTALKIDRSFVTDLPTSHTDRAIVAATLELARALELTVTAEGVETQEQRDVLIELGCPSAQGYLLGRPMPAKDFAALLG